MKKVLAFDIDDTLNVAKTPITKEMAITLRDCLDHFHICPISGQKFDQFLIQIVNPLIEVGATPLQISHLHLFVAQGTQYYRYHPVGTRLGKEDGPFSLEVTNFNKIKYHEKDWQQVYNNPLTDEQIEKVSKAIEKAARELGYWEEGKLQEGDEIIENRLSQVTFSALGQKAGTKEKYAWDQDHKKREAIVEKCKELAPEFEYEIGGTTSINAFTPGMNKVFGMTHLLEELNVKQDDVLYFGDMTQPGGNDYPIVEMGVDTITVRNWEDTCFALKGILGVL